MTRSPPIGWIHAFAGASLGGLGVLGVAWPTLGFLSVPDHAARPSSFVAAVGPFVVLFLPTLLVAWRVSEGVYGPFGLSMGVLYAIPAGIASMAFSPGYFVTGPLVAVLGVAFVVLVVSLWLCAVGMAVGGGDRTDGTLSAPRRWLWRAGWQPWVVVPCGVAGLFLLGSASSLDGLPALLSLVAVTFCPWVAAALYVHTASDDVVDSFRTLTEDRTADAPDQFRLVGGSGGLPLAGDRWITATRVSLDDSALQFDPVGRLDLQTLGVYDGPEARTLPYDRIDGAEYDDGRLAVLTEDGHTHTVRCERRPDELLAQLDRRAHDRSPRPRIDSRVTGRRPTP